MPEPTDLTALRAAARVESVREYIVLALMEGGSMYRDGAESFLAEHDAKVRTAALGEAADSIVAACFTHNPGAATGWITCHCEVADDLRKQAVLRVLPTPR